MYTKISDALEVIVSHCCLRVCTHRTIVLKPHCYQQFCIKVQFTKCIHKLIHQSKGGIVLYNEWSSVYLICWNMNKSEWSVSALKHFSWIVYPLVCAKLVETDFHQSITRYTCNGICCGWGRPHISTPSLPSDKQRLKKHPFPLVSPPFSCNEILIMPQLLPNIDT